MSWLNVSDYSSKLGEKFSPKPDVTEKSQQLSCNCALAHARFEIVYIYIYTYIYIYIYTYFLWRCDPKRVMASSFLRFLDHTHRSITIGRTPLDKWSARCRDLYLTKHNTHNRQTSMPPIGFEPTISAGERPQTYALDRAATGTGIYIHNFLNLNKVLEFCWCEIYQLTSIKLWYFFNSSCNVHISTTRFTAEYDLEHFNKWNDKDIVCINL